MVGEFPTELSTNVDNLAAKFSGMRHVSELNNILDK